MAPNRKPPPRLTSPPPRMGRAPSLHTGHDEQGRPIAWGASRSRPSSEAILSRPPSQHANQYDSYDEEIREEDIGVEEGAGLIASPVPTREGQGQGQALTNFEAAVAALRATVPAPKNPTAAPTPRYTTRSQGGTIALDPTNTAAPVDPNYPTNFQFHKTPGYISQPAPITPHHQTMYQTIPDPPLTQSPGLPLPVSINPKKPTGLGISSGTGGKRNVSGPLRRRARRSRSPTPFPDEDEGQEIMGDTMTTVDADPFGAIEVDLSRRDERVELNQIYDQALERERSQRRKGFAEFVDRDAETTMGMDEKDVGEIDLVPSYEYDRGYNNGETDLASYHTHDPYSPSDKSDLDEDEKARLASDFPPSSTAHFGPAPEGRVMRRHKQQKAKKVVELTEGNLVIDLKIPTRLEGFLPTWCRGRMGEQGEEVLSTRYSAVTSTPDDFIARNFTLRQTLYGRETELMIVITMYNEDEVLFLRTLYGVMRNISHLEGRKNSGTWGAGSWKKVVVCIVADGRKNINPRVLDCLASLGVYQEGAMKNSVQDEPVQAHLFEYTCTMGLTPDLKFKFASADKGMVPTQIIFCLKEKNAKKINSHRWFFNAFCRSLDPKVCILLDVGTRPAPKSLYHLWKAFDKNSSVGGACGEIAVYKGRAWRSLLNPLVACQNFEYKISNVLDKTTESVFGYCAVLPGAFSAYRWIALQNDASGKGPLASYFKGEVLHGRDADTFTANMYLAEDRILCWEIVAKPKHNYVLKYVSAAVGETDAPEAVPEFISQRRRWLNGSFFAAVYALLHVFELFKTDHSIFRKTILLVQALYNAIMLLFSWFSLANFYIFFVILTSSLEDPAFGVPKISILNAIMQYIYLGTVVACFLFSMGNRPRGSVWKYMSAIAIFAVLTIYMLVAAVICMVRAFKLSSDPIFARMLVSVVATYGVYVMASILALDPFHLLTSAGQYILFQASSINILNVYAFSNIDDLSWGTKGADTMQDDLGAVKGNGKEVEVELLANQRDVDAAYSDALDNLRVRKPLEVVKKVSASEEEQERKDYYANVRTNVLLCYALSNALLASLILRGNDASSSFSGNSNRTTIYMLFILIFVAGTSLLRFLGALIYLILRLFGN